MSDDPVVFENKLNEMIDHWLKERQIWVQKRLQAERQLREIDSNLAALEGTLKVYKGQTGEIGSVIASSVQFRFENLSVPDSCELILKEKGGQAKVTDVLKILKDAGKIKNSRTGYAQVFDAMRGDSLGRFKKIGRGEFALVESPVEEGV